MLVQGEQRAAAGVRLAPRVALRREHDLADVLARLEILVRRRSLREGALRTSERAKVVSIRVDPGYHAALCMPDSAATPTGGAAVTSPRRAALFFVEQGELLAGFGRRAGHDTPRATWRCPRTPLWPCF